MQSTFLVIIYHINCFNMNINILTLENEIIL